jgi:hypothetical protein
MLNARERERIRTKYEAEAKPPPRNLKVSDVFAYLHYKAFVYLQLGPAEYRKGDYFNLPPEDLPRSRLDVIRSGCEQILLWKGFSAQCPLEGIGIEGFYDLLQLFHFKLAEQAIVDGGGGKILDEMQMEHVVDSRTITLYNLVEPPSVGGLPAVR